MNTAIAIGNPSEAARHRLLACRGEPLFYTNWDRALFIHYETNPQILQQGVPYHLDLYDGRAFVSLVAFTMRAMRPRFGGRMAEWMVKPIATHHFLNVRTYVVHKGEPGIYFMAEWLSNRVAALLGPWTFGLPYRFGHLHYTHNHEADELCGHVAATHGQLSYHGAVENDNFATCEPGSLTDFLLERYTAFTKHGGRRRFFRVWHEPWQQVAVEINMTADDLIGTTGNWWRNARCIGANYSPGVNVWMGWPHRLTS